MTIKYVASSELPTQWGTFAIHGFDDSENNKEHLALTFGDFGETDNGGNGKVHLCRVHSECLTGDALFSLRCDCGPQLQSALQQISNEGCGVLLYLRQEGRGIGLLNKIKAYSLQDAGADTVEANEQLGFDADSRDYSMCKQMLAHLKIGKVKLLTNNPEKVDALEKLGIEVVERIPIHTGHNPHNENYLSVKVDKLGHIKRDEA